jgi:predicted kinase
LELVLIRGLPGSGKSTMATVVAQVDYEHFEAGVWRGQASP